MIEEWASNRNLIVDSKEFRIYLICFMMRHSDKATIEMWFAFSSLYMEPIEC